MLELASLGAKVLQIRSVEFARKYGVPLRVLSSFEDGPGTLIGPDVEDELMEQPLISGIAFTRDEAKVTIMGVQDRPGVAFSILGPVADENIEVDMIVQNAGADGMTDFTFTVHRDDFARTLQIVRDGVAHWGASEVTGDDRIVRFRSSASACARTRESPAACFRRLAVENINIQMISTSEIKVSVVVDEKYLELGVRALHTAFGLEEGRGLHGLGLAAGRPGRRETASRGRPARRTEPEGAARTSSARIGAA